MSLTNCNKASSTQPFLSLGNKILVTTLKMVLADIHHTQVHGGKEHNLEVNDVVYTICLVSNYLTASNFQCLILKSIV